jgi:hypothetical protein
VLSVWLASAGAWGGVGSWAVGGGDEGAWYACWGAWRGETGEVETAGAALDMAAAGAAGAP